MCLQFIFIYYYTGHDYYWILNVCFSYNFSQVAVGQCQQPQQFIVKKNKIRLKKPHRYLWKVILSTVVWTLKVRPKFLAVSLWYYWKMVEHLRRGT